MRVEVGTEKNKQFVAVNQTRCEDGGFTYVISNSRRWDEELRREQHPQPSGNC